MKVIVLSIALLFIGLTVQSQTNTLDNLYTPTSPSLLNSDSKGKNGSGEGSYENLSNAVKFCPTLLSRGIFAFQYERYIASSSISLNLSLGSTIARDYLQLLSSSFYEEFGESDNTAISYYDILASGDYVAKSNLYFATGIKIYSDSYSKDNSESYFEFAMRRYNQVYSVPFVNYNIDLGLVNTFQNTTVRTTNFNFIYGTSLCTSGKIVTTHDFFCGLGVRLNTAQNFDLVNTLDGSGGNAYSTYLPLSTRSFHLGINAVLGYTFGIGW
jgi:hypothetical protein